MAMASATRIQMTWLSVNAPILVRVTGAGFTAVTVAVMSRYGVTVQLDDLYYEVEAPNEDEAIFIAFELARKENYSGFMFDCDEVVDLDD